MPRHISVSRADNPEFVPSLRLLVEREKYCLSDIALMFTVSRERVRQWLKQYEIRYQVKDFPRGLRACRMWNDELNRFFPVSIGKMKKEQTSKGVELRMQLKQARWKAQQLHIVETIVELQNKLGRFPTTLEMAEVLGFQGDPLQAGSFLARSWCGGGNTQKKYQAFRSALTAAGVEARKSGAAGQVNPRKPYKKRTHCKRNHLMSETRDKWGRCGACDKIMDKTLRDRKKNQVIKK